MTRESKFFIGVGLLTLLILVGAAIFLSGSPAPQSTEVADAKTLLKSDSHATNPKGAKVTIVEFGDYQCPACGQAHPIVKRILEEYKDKINFVFRNFPLESAHKNARIAALAAEAASEQNKFWEMHDILYENQTEWENSNAPLDLFMEYAKQVKLDEAKFKTAVEKKTFNDRVQNDYEDGIRLGINSTPTFFINGVKQQGSLPEAEFKQKIDAELKK